MGNRAGGINWREARERMRRSGYNVTPQRRVVLDALKEFGGHPTADAVYVAAKKRDPKVALGTVYQALSILEEIGLIAARRWPGSPTRYDLNTEPHLDIRCIGCSEVVEVLGAEAEDHAARLQGHTDYKVTGAALVVEGVCPECLRGD